MKLRSGQVALYLIVVLVVLCVLTVMNVDIFVTVRAKNRVQNAGDAAALAAARVQGRLLNDIGELNFKHLAAAVRNDREACAEIVREQQWKALIEPVSALAEADEAARRNGMEPNEDFARLLREHAETVRRVYAGGGEAGDPYPEPWQGAWAAYAAAIDDAVRGGLAMGPDNVEFYDAQGGHLLLLRNFYYAISAQDWCWFHFNAEQVLNTYKTYHDWAQLPRRGEHSMENSEIFSLHVVARKGALTEIFSLEQLVELYEKYGDEKLSLEDFQQSTILTNREETWFFYDPGFWRKWHELSPYADGEGGAFPIVGEVKREYDVRGCAAICRCVNTVAPVVSEEETQVTWSAAAKPLGTVETQDGVAPVNAWFNFIVPCFEAVRLVALDAVGGENLATADAGWVDHVRQHLPVYMEEGPRLRDCFWCNQLVTWETESFRQTGVNWLKFHAGDCIRPMGHGPGRGGTSHGH